MLFLVLKVIIMQSKILGSWKMFPQGKRLIYVDFWHLVKLKHEIHKENVKQIVHYKYSGAAEQDVPPVTYQHHSVDLGFKAILMELHSNFIQRPNTLVVRGCNIPN